MGKLGGGELNFSSDIDLVFLYPEAGETDGRRPASNEEYFTRLGQALIRLLDARTPEGFVFRVDMRLRPLGEPGPLAMNFAAFEGYLQQHGRDWERYAWVKARAITGASRYRTLQEDVVRPFVYRRYLDYGVYESLREMKALIAREVERRELRDNVKLGPGGIREIEFIVQSQQLIRGGAEPRLRTPSLLTALPRLAGAKLLAPGAVAELTNAYAFLRKVENRLQMADDAQTHALPDDAAGRARLARSMGFTDWTAFTGVLEGHRQRVTAHFDAVVLGRGGSAPAADPGFAATWQAGPSLEGLTEAARTWGLADPEAAARVLMELRESGYFRRLDEFGRRRLAVLLPRMLAAVARAQAAVGGEGQATLTRLLRIVEAIGGRTAYLALLNENVQALDRLVQACRMGDYLARQVAAHPLLLDELLDARVFDTAPDRAQFRAELAARLEHAGADEEQRVDALRQFRRAATFRIAMQDLSGRLPLMQVSDRLTDVAELILEQALGLAWQHTAARYGEPRAGADRDRRTVRVGIAGYGKLGGMELGYASDLDLVFLHDAPGPGETSGPKSVDNEVFFLRLAQRLLHLLTVHTAAGRLYEVDVRLRPAGKGGLAFTQIGAFEAYQRREAWTFEHQALLHSRWVAGDPALGAEFARVRRGVLVEAVRRPTLREDVLAMRERMRAERGRPRDDRFDLKHDRGGITDIEFLAQYWVLRHVREHPPLAFFADTIRHLESVGSAGLVDHGVIDRLVDAYRAYRQAAHHLSLEQRPAVVDAGEFATERAAVCGIWDRVMVAGGEPAPV
jgi:glutamate-ammonia-ligase adenylyltransferase